MVFNGPHPMQKEKIKKLLYFWRNRDFKNVSILKISKKSQFLAPSSEPHWGPLGMGGPNRDSHWDTLGHGVILSIPIGTPLATVSFYFSFFFLRFLGSDGFSKKTQASSRATRDGPLASLLV